MMPNQVLSAEDQKPRLRQATAPQVTLWVYVLLGLLLAITSGHWTAGVCLLVMCGLYGTFMVRCVARPRFAHVLDFNAQGALALTLLFFSVILCVHPGLLYAEHNAWFFVLVLVLICLLAASLTLTLASAGRWNLSAIGFQRTALAAFVCLIALRLLTIAASPNPDIDVIYVNQQACDYFLQGKNPYAGKYEDVYAGKYEYRPAFFYWPATLYWNLPFRGLVGDVRYGTVLAEALTAACLLWAARRTALPNLAALLVPLVWLAFPVSLFVVEQAWTDPLLILGTAAVIVTLGRRDWWLCGIALGWLAATKQYGGVIGVMTLAWLAGRDLRATWRSTVASAVTFGLLMVPMVCWDPAAFYQSTFATIIDAAPRDDALGITALFLRNEIAVPRALFTAVTLVAIAALATGCLLSRDSVDHPRRWAANLAAAYWTAFLLGKVAFCNYYYLIAFVVFASFVLSLPRAMRTESSIA